jgi:hypothetical protein
MTRQHCKSFTTTETYQALDLTGKVGGSEWYAVAFIENLHHAPRSWIWTTSPGWQFPLHSLAANCGSRLIAALEAGSFNRESRLAI